MGARSVLVLSLLCVWGAVRAEEGGHDQYKTPSFCGKLECPRYHVEQDFKSFELRVYEATQWVSTPVNLNVFGTGKAFRRLFKYITGSNSEGLKINMTVPVLVYLPINNPSANATMSFYLTPTLSPPKPLDPDVFLGNAGETRVYVKSFGGYAFDYEYAKQAKLLSEELLAHGIQFDDSAYERAGYNDPFTFFNRHNEVWYLAK
ncbi:Hypothetical predicted protein [Pelobates cultripes]|uniref:Heme-binding protein 1 n=1 Tax=Pelobates cultripes TaxID=61616 RepID=A0AAD1RH21_PELCU|nr:Hypothetical predicted protein [Pelobates cultripes]